jgi:hypothetical protein
MNGCGRETGFAQFRRERHRETARVRGGNQFFWIRANAVLEAGVERILRFLEHGAFSGNTTLAGFQIA